MMNVYFLIKRTVVAIFMLLLFFFISCSDIRELKIDRTNVPVQLLQAVMLESDSLFYGSVNALWEDSYVLLTSYKRDRLFEIFELKNDSLIFRKSFLGKGEGPYEMFTPIFCYNIENKDFIVSDANMKNGLIINLADINTVDSVKKWMRTNVFALDQMYNWYGYVASSDSTILAKMSNPGKKSILAELSLYDEKIKDIEDFWPADGFDGAYRVKQAEYSRGKHSRLLKQPGNNRYFYSSRHGYYAELFSLDNGKAVNKQILFDIFPEYSTKDELNPIEDDNTGMGMDVYATETYLYIKFNRGTVGDYREQIRDPNRKLTDDYSFNNEILVYNWKGELLKIYQLDTLVRSFFVNDNDRFILANTDDNESGETLVLRYNLE